MKRLALLRTAPAGLLGGLVSLLARLLAASVLRPALGHQKLGLALRQVECFARVRLGEVDPVDQVSELARQADLHPPANSGRRRPSSGELYSFMSFRRTLVNVL